MQSFGRLVLGTTGQMVLHLADVFMYRMVRMTVYGLAMLASDICESLLWINRLQIFSPSIGILLGLKGKFESCGFILYISQEG